MILLFSLTTFFMLLPLVSNEMSTPLVVVSHEPTLFDIGLDDEVTVVSLYSDSKEGRLKGQGHCTSGNIESLEKVVFRSWGFNFSILTELGCHRSDRKTEVRIK